MSSPVPTVLLRRGRRVCCRAKPTLLATTSQQDKDKLLEAVIKFLASEEKKMDRWYCKKQNGYLCYYISPSTGGRMKQTGGAPGCLFGLRKKHNYILPQPEPTPSNPLAMSPVTPIPNDEAVDLPQDILDIIVGTTIKETGEAVKGVDLTNENTQVRELHNILAKTLNSMSASKLLRRSMFEQLERLRQQKANANATKKSILENLNVRISMILAEVQMAIESYDGDRNKGSRIKCATKNLYKFLREVGLEHMANDLTANIFVSLKDWNFDAYAAMIENAVRAKIEQNDKKDPSTGALLLLPYGKFHESIANIFNCILSIMLNVPSTRSTCNLILSNDMGTNGITINFTYEEITLIPFNQHDERKIIKYQYYMTEQQEHAVRTQFVQAFTDMIKNMPYLQFTEFNVVADGIEDIIVDLETLVNTKPLSYFIAQGARHIPERRHWVLHTPLKYLVGKLTRDNCIKVYESHKQNLDQVNLLLVKVQTALRELKPQDAASGGRKKNRLIK